MKKLTALLLALSLVATFAGCGSTTSNDSAASDVATAEVSEPVAAAIESEVPEAIDDESGTTQLTSEEIWAGIHAYFEARSALRIYYARTIVDGDTTRYSYNNYAGSGGGTADFNWEKSRISSDAIELVFISRGREECENFTTADEVFNALLDEIGITTDPSNWEYLLDEENETTLTLTLKEGYVDDFMQLILDEFSFDEITEQTAVICVTYEDGVFKPTEISYYVYKDETHYHKGSLAIVL